MGLRDIESTLPPGFKFFPSDEELVCHYLYKKVSNEKVVEGTMVEVDLHMCEPWELPEVAKLSASEWYFFSFRDRKYATGSRTNRATKSGYWKATGKDRTIYNALTHEIIGMRKTLVFYCGRAPSGIKSSWVMHEFRLENPHTPPKEDWVLCRVFHKRNGEEEMNRNSSCPSPLNNIVPQPPLIGDPQMQRGGIYENIGSSISINGPQIENNNNSSSSFNIDVANLLQFNFHGSIPQVEMEEFGLFMDVGSEENAMGYGNLGDFRFQVGRDKLY